MKVCLWLDDIRKQPVDTHDTVWLRAWTAHEAITAIKLAPECWDLISLDHDLGPGLVGTGYTVLRWLENQVAADPNYPVPEIRIHSANPVGRQNMEAAIRSIRKLQND